MLFPIPLPCKSWKGKEAYLYSIVKNNSLFDGLVNPMQSVTIEKDL